MSLISFKNVSYTYPRTEQCVKECPTLRHAALHDITLDFEQHCRVALLGANGAGKSTLILHCNGILRPSKGVLYFKNDPITYSKQYLTTLRSRIAMVFQNPEDQLFAATLKQDVSFGPLAMGLSTEEVHQRVKKALVAMGLMEFSAMPLHMLSHGMRKRAAIAGALAMNPEMLILDEPTAGLDPLSETLLLSTLSQLHESGISILLSTHNVDLALQWAQTVVVMHHGTIVSHGCPKDVLGDESLMKLTSLRVPVLLKHQKIISSAPVWQSAELLKLFDDTIECSKV